MPRGERQTTGTAQALLGAKQIAAGERASKRATVADYVKTGVGALKSVGDYLPADLPADSLHVQVLRTNLTLDHLVELVDLVAYRWVHPKD